MRHFSRNTTPSAGHEPIASRRVQSKTAQFQYGLREPGFADQESEMSSRSAANASSTSRRASS